MMETMANNNLGFPELLKPGISDPNMVWKSLTKILFGHPRKMGSQSHYSMNLGLKIEKGFLEISILNKNSVYMCHYNFSTASVS